MQVERITLSELERLYDEENLSPNEETIEVVLSSKREAIPGAFITDEERVKFIDEGFAGDNLYLIGHEYGATHLVRARSECEAWGAYIDECKTIPVDEVCEAYGAFDKLLERMESRGHANDYTLRSFCNRWAQSFFGVATRDANHTGAWDDWNLIEGYEYQSNATGTGIVNVGHYVWMRDIDSDECEILFSGELT